MEIFKQKVTSEKLCDEYIKLSSLKGFSPAKGLINKIASNYTDLDGNFVEQFQSNGFYPRLWELFLNQLFEEESFENLNDNDRPDFHFSKDDYDFYLEASCSNSNASDIYTEEIIKDSLKKMDRRVEKKLIDYYTIKIGSVLFSKLSKKYWELDWVKGKPLVFGVLPSHNSLARFMPDYKITEYLYGIEYKPAGIIDNKIQYNKRKLETHSHENKTIRANFFSLPDTENISAILFSNTCDIQKFNRMGQQGDFFDPDIILFRQGLCFDINSEYPKDFRITVREDEHIETWAEGVTLFHNPNAKIPFKKGLFKNLREVWIDSEGKFDGTSPAFHPYMSVSAGLFYT